MTSCIVYSASFSRNVGGAFQGVFGTIQGVSGGHFGSSLKAKLKEHNRKTNNRNETAAKILFVVFLHVCFSLVIIYLMRAVQCARCLICFWSNLRFAIGTKSCGRLSKEFPTHLALTSRTLAFVSKSLVFASTRFVLVGTTQFLLLSIYFLLAKAQFCQ